MYVSVCIIHSVLRGTSGWLIRSNLTATRSIPLCFRVGKDLIPSQIVQYKINLSIKVLYTHTSCLISAVAWNWNGDIRLCTECITKHAQDDKERATRIQKILQPSGNAKAILHYTLSLKENKVGFPHRQLGKFLHHSVNAVQLEKNRLEILTYTPTELSREKTEPLL